MPPRQLASQQALPRLSAFAVDSMVKWLLDHEHMLRPPEVTARFLVFCVKLHQLGRAFPPRAEAAAHLGCSVAMIDTSLSHRLATGDIRVEIRTAEGNVQRRPSTVRIRMVVPSTDIINIVEEAEKLEKLAVKNEKRRARRKLIAKTVVTATVLGFFKICCIASMWSIG